VAGKLAKDHKPPQGQGAGPDHAPGPQDSGSLHLEISATAELALGVVPPAIRPVVRGDGARVAADAGYTPPGNRTSPAGTRTGAELPQKPALTCLNESVTVRAPVAGTSCDSGLVGAAPSSRQPSAATNRRELKSIRETATEMEPHVQMFPSAVFRVGPISLTAVALPEARTSLRNSRQVDFKWACCDTMAAHRRQALPSTPGIEMVGLALGLSRPDER
jgi:hypothetical protein